MTAPPQPIGRFDETSGHWIAAQDWSVQLADGRTLRVLAGFSSDGASIPRPLWPLVGPRFSARTFPAALAHDALYASEWLPRAQADAEFYRLLRLTGVGRVKARSFWLAVRAAGWLVWRRHLRCGIELARLWVRVD
jgi:hypothetical protein